MHNQGHVPWIDQRNKFDIFPKGKAAKQCSNEIEE